MEQNNIITEELMDGAEVVAESSRNGKGAAMLIGGAIALGVVVAAKKLKKVYANHKSKKEQAEIADVQVNNTDDEDFDE